MPRLLGFAFLMSALPCAAKADDLDGHKQTGLRFYYESHNPQFSTDAKGKLIGPSADPISALMTTSPVPIRLVEDSWTRALTTVLSEKNTCLVPLARTQERDPNFIWIGPLAKLGFGLYALKERHLNVDSLDAVARLNLVVGVVANEASDSIAKPVPGLRRDAVTASALNFRKLLAGRIDFLISREDTANNLMSDDARSRIEKVLDLPKIDLSIGCNIGSDAEAMSTLQTQLMNYFKPR